MKRKKKIVRTLIIAAVIAIAAYSGGCGRNSDPATGGDTGASQQIQSDESQNQTDIEKKDQNNSQKNTDQKRADQKPSDQKLSKQESDQLADDMLGSLNDLEETVNSLDDVTDNDLQVPE